MLRIFLTLIVTAVLSAPSHGQTGTVIVLALDGSGDATTLTEAVDLAISGDIILARAGSYVPSSPLAADAYVPISKGVTIIGEGSGASFGMIGIIGIPANESVVFRNVTVSFPALATFDQESLTVRNSLGTVALEDCTLLGQPGEAPFPSVGFPGVAVRDSAGVSLTRCTIQGGDGMVFGSALAQDPVGGAAALVMRSSVTFQHCTLTGGRGGSQPNISSPGGSGLRSDRSNVFVSGCTLQGGDGSNGGDPNAPASAAGGNAITQVGAVSILRLRDTTLAGGLGGQLSDGSFGPNGQLTAISAGLLQNLSFTARQATLTALVREGQPATLTVSGPAGQAAGLLLAIELSYAQLSGSKGVSLLAPPFLGPIALGTIPGPGTLQLSLPIAAGALQGLDGLRIDVQAFTAGSEGLILSNLTSTVIVDPAF